MKAKLLDLISRFLCRFVNKQDFFVTTGNTILSPKQNPNRNFYDIDNLADYQEICRKYNFTVTDADVKDRFDQKHHLCVITEEDHYGCWGWYTTTTADFAVTEIACSSPVPENTTILFHYHTNENHRRKGYYFELLKNVVISSKKEYAIIYAYDTNIASSSAIKKAGFQHIGRMNHKTFIPFSQMISVYNAEDKHK